MVLLLGRLALQTLSFTVAKLDTARVAVAGHSLGGLAALLGVEQEARFKASIIIDGLVPDALAQRPSQAGISINLGIPPVHCGGNSVFLIMARY